MFAFLLLALNLALGLWGGDYNGAADEYLAAQREVDATKRSLNASTEKTQAAQQKLVAVAAEVQPVVRRAQWHMGVGILAALVNVLVNSITITYFVGTSRWVREVVETYHLSTEHIRRANRIKRGTFPMALGAILLILTIVALGAASDPSAVVQNSEQYVILHFTVALVGVTLIGWSFLIQARNLGANAALINQIVEEVQTIRQERGLATQKPQ